MYSTLLISCSSNIYKFIQCMYGYNSTAVTSNKGFRVHITKVILVDCEKYWVSFPIEKKFAREIYKLLIKKMFKWSIFFQI